MANLTDTTKFKKLNSETPMYNADNVDFLINGLSATYAEKDDVYTIDEADAKFATKEDISSVYHFKGSVDTYLELKALTGMEVGDVYNVDESGKNYGWTGVTSAYDDGWDVLGGTFDLTDYYTKEQADDLLDDKVDKVEGKQLSTEDFTSAYKAKLDDIAPSAQVNVVETVKVDGTALTPDANKAVNIDLATPLAAKADNDAFISMSGFQVVNVNDFDMEELATKYNAVVTALSGIAIALNS